MHNYVITAYRGLSANCVREGATRDEAPDGKDFCCSGCPGACHDVDDKLLVSKQRI